MILLISLFLRELSPVIFIGYSLSMMAEHRSQVVVPELPVFNTKFFLYLKPNSPLPNTSHLFPFKITFIPSF